MHTASYEFLMKPKESAGCHQTLSVRVGSGDETTLPLTTPAHLSPTVTWLAHDSLLSWFTCHMTIARPVHSPLHIPHIWYTPLCPQIHWREKHHSRSFWKLNTNKLNFSNISPSRLSLLHQSLCVCFLSNYTYLQATVSNHCLAWIGYDQLEV